MTTLPRPVVIVLAALVGVALLPSFAALAAETDQFYSWYTRIPDGEKAIDAHVNAGFDEALDEVNRCSVETRRARTCSDVALQLMGKHFRASVWFVIGATRDWGYPYRPASTTEFAERYEPVSLYRYFGLFPFGVLIPVDPTIRAGDVYFGPDKLGHFLQNGTSYWKVYQAARARGLSVDDARKEAIQLGIDQEAGILGGVITSSFSYADLEANFQGLELMRSFCEGDAAHLPTLVLDGDRWVLKERFAIARWLSPCWDESFYPNAYDRGEPNGLVGNGVKKALLGYCKLRTRPDIAARRQLYKARGCSSFSVHHLDQLVAEGKIPDPRPFTLERACGDPPARPAP